MICRLSTTGILQHPDATPLAQDALRSAEPDRAWQPGVKTPQRWVSIVAPAPDSRPGQTLTH